MNLLPGVIIQTSAQTQVQLDSGCVVTSAIATEAGDEGKRINVGIRPEDLVPCAEGGVYQGRVDYTEALGDVTLLYFHHDSGHEGVVAKVPGIHMELRDSIVKVSADPSKVHLFYQGQSIRS